MEPTASPATLATLRRFGLTDDQARTYLALVRLGTAGPDALAEAADVPTDRLPRALYALEAGGWLVRERRPERYTAVPPARRLARAWRDAQEDLEAAERELESLTAPVNAPPEPAGADVLEGDAVVRGYVERLLSGARENIFCSLPFVLPRLDPVVTAPHLEEAATRGVQVRLLVHANALPELAEGPEWEAVLDAGVEARLTTLPARFLVADQRRALMVLPPDDEATEARALWNPLEPFVQLTRPALDGFWRDATPIGTDVRAQPGREPVGRR